MPGPTLPLSFPFKLSSVDPDGATESCRFLDNRLREIHYQIALLLGLPMDTNIIGPIPLAASMLGTLNQDSRWLSTTTFQLDADQVITGDTNSHLKLHVNPAPIVVNISTAGPTPNGRDQAGAFVGPTFIHFYWIYNGTTLAGIASTTAPSAGGPTLPGGYFLGAYAGAIRLNAAGQLVQSYIRGRWTYYHAQNVVLNAGGAGTNVLVDCSTYVPANAVAMALAYSFTATALKTFTFMDGVQNIAAVVTTNNAGSQSSGGLPLVGNYNRSVYYTITAGSTPALSLTLNAFENPNNG